MPAKLSSVSFGFGTASVGQSENAERKSPERFNIIVFGDFTGRANRGAHEPLAVRELLFVDVDNFARVFGQLRAKLKLSGAGVPESGFELEFATLEDFHPDKLLERIPPLGRLAEARRLVLNPATAEQGKAALQACLGAATASPAEPNRRTPAPAAETEDDMMARLLGGAPPVKKSATPASQLEQFIRQVVAPHVSSASWQSGAVAAAEMELAHRINAILHHPDFQALEAAWRGVDLLVRRIESYEEIGLLVLDTSLAELLTDLEAHESFDQSTLFRLLRDHKPSLLVGNYTLGRTANDLRVLGKIAEIATELSAPFVATAAPRLVGCDSFALHPDPDDWKLKLPTEVAETWEALRQSPHAAQVGLTAPRFLLRQPYGKTGDAIETFPFEELPGEPPHESFLWGHAANLCACAVIDARQAGDTNLADFTGGEIGDLPVHKFTEEGEVVVKPYAEAWLTDRAVARMLSHGVIPIVGVKNLNAVRIPGFHSIAREPTKLAFDAS